MSVGFPLDVSGSSHSFVSDGMGGGKGEVVAAVQHDLAHPAKIDYPVLCLGARRELARA
jgi:hypothetical protein